VQFSIVVVLNEVIADSEYNFDQVRDFLFGIKTDFRFLEFLIKMKKGCTFSLYIN